MNSEKETQSRWPGQLMQWESGAEGSSFVPTAFCDPHDTFVCSAICDWCDKKQQSVSWHHFLLHKSTDV